MRDDSQVTPLPQQGLFSGNVSAAELTRVVNLLLESSRMTTQRIDAFERSSAELRRADREHHAAMRQNALEDRQAILSAIRSQGSAIEALTAQMGALRESVAAYSGHPPGEQSKIKQHAPAALGGAGALAVVVELARAIVGALK
jgi:hypothetical protein